MLIVGVIDIVGVILGVIDIVGVILGVIDIVGVGVCVGVSDGSGVGQRSLFVTVPTETV